MEGKKFKISRILIHAFFIIACITYIVPMLYVISISFSSQKDLTEFGYQIIPHNWSLEAYKYIFRNPTQLLDSYKTTVIFSLVGSFGGLVIMSMAAYPLSRQSFTLKRPMSLFIFFTMLFNGGLIPTYILNTQYLGLGNSIWIYILPGLVSAWYIIILRTFFSQLPQALVESAKLDGASELCIFFRIILPLSKPVLATVLLMTLLAKWNDWYTTLIYIRDQELYSLQYMLQRILREVEFIKSISSGEVGAGIIMETDVPTEPVRYALLMVAAGPMLVVFPFFQKYFTKGLTVGSVKG